MDLTRDDRPDPDAIRRCETGTEALCTALADAPSVERAAIAMVLGSRGARAAAATLLGGLDDEGLAGRAAAWALGRVGSQDELLAACAEGRLDRRENAYWALAHLAANGGTGESLGDAMVARVDAELARAAEGGSGLGEHACRVLAVLGDPRAEESCERVVAEDPYADRFELDRLRRQLADEGRDAEGARELAGDWDAYFSDDLAGEESGTEEADAVAPAPDPAAPLDGSAGGPQPVPGGEAAPAGERPAPPPPPPSEQAEGAGEEEEAVPEAEPVDWQAFAESPEAQELDPQLQQLLLQIGPMLEQLALGAVRVPLVELQAQEFAALMLQVLPQAVQPQYVQALLSPEALRALQAWAKWVEAQGKAGELLAGVKMVREELRAQVRASGMLGGPDYGDPDDAPSDAPGTGTSTE